ncbi:MAG: hypothetical protein HOO96_01240 [Polyangiaceae bacterium]|nr:hypothetical protein [Polyangiaceae bacterium]
MVAPLPEQMNDFGGNGKLPNEVRIGLAGIVAVAPGTDLSGRTRPVPVLGVVEDYEVVYVERDAVPNTIAAAFLGGPLRAGFHLMRVVRSSLSSVDQYKASQACYAALPPGTSEQQRYVQCHPSDIFDKLQEAEQGFDTNITLKLAPAKQLDFPNTF